MSHEEANSKVIQPVYKNFYKRAISFTEHSCDNPVSIFVVWQTLNLLNKMEITDIFLNLIQYPNSSKNYRMLKDLYKKMGKDHESKSFSYLLETKFQELTDDNNHSDHQKS